MKKTILFVGEDPRATTGNGHMMHAVIDTLEDGKYDFACFGASEAQQADAFSARLPFKFISA